MPCLSVNCFEWCGCILASFQKNLAICFCILASAVLAASWVSSSELSEQRTGANSASTASPQEHR